MLLAQCVQVSKVQIEHEAWFYDEGVRAEDGIFVILSWNDATPD